NEPRWRLLFPTVPKNQNLVRWGWWVNGREYTERQPLEQMNWKLPASLDTSVPASTDPAWSSLFYKRLNVYGSEHPGGCNLAFADGSVKFVSDTTSLLTLSSLSTKATGD